ncbi:hypothetical protein K491DRAFT_719812 [Lophiostoma macrostomum CBS 122681]|uniref:Uncharacterized protein n=1 Tax=Lophiostoma macrostomum CBS 122681 TaxID=1314788 RepID=A0A6A6SWW4_9PLEO|nr:hypothetical protein K491DRAFT_719812 [Lophiostoma macrostomum CBS 122681]
MTRETEGEEYDGEEEEMTLCLENLITPRGGTIRITMDVKQEDILAEEFYDGRSPDSEDEGEYTGNEGMNNTYRYHNSVMVLVRKDYDFSQQLTIGCKDVASLKTFFDLVRMDPTAADGMLLFILRGAIKKMTGKYGRSYSYTSYYHYASPARNIDSDKELLQLFFDIANYCRSTGRRTQLCGVLQEAMQDPDWSSSMDLVRVIAKQVSVDIDAGIDDAWNMFGKGFDKPTFECVNRTRLLVEKIGPALPRGIRHSFEEWTSARLTKNLGAINTYSAEDIPAIMNLIPSLPIENYFNNILPILSRPSCREALARVLTQIGEKAFANLNSRNQTGATNTWDDLLKPSYETILRYNGPKLKITKRDFDSATGSTSNFYRVSYHDTSYPVHSSYTISHYLLQFLAIIRRTVALGLHEAALDLVSTALPDLNDAEFAFETSIPPAGLIVFVEKLAAVLNKIYDRALESAIVRFMKMALQKAAEWLTKRRPKELQSWARAITPCLCAACIPLNDFLRSATRSSARFTSVLKVRSHLEQQVPHRQGYECVTERHGTPHTLIVYKASREYCRSYEQWQSDVTALRHRLS